MVVGVDGCSAGWLVVVIMANLGWEIRIFPNIQSVWDTYKAAEMILVDIPIGLSENGDRVCDREARALLGPRRAVSVFSAPCRPALYAASYGEACDINQAHTRTRLSKQSWAISKKILEVDEFTRRTPEARGIVREIHPEVCFCALNHGAMHHRKKTPEGSRERIAVLEHYYPRIHELVTYHRTGRVRRSSASLDDVLDAAAAAITGLGDPNQITTIPEKPPVDDYGLPMEMVLRKNDATLCR